MHATMAMSSSWPQFFIISNILINLARIAVAQPLYLYHFCVNTGNYTNTSTYRANLDTLLPSLSLDVDQYGFHHASRGQGSDTVNAIVLCRGDVQLDLCRRCVDDATVRIKQECPNYKEVAVWYDQCMLRYSNRTILGTRTDEQTFFMWNTQNASDPVQFNQRVVDMLDSLRTEAASGGRLRKFATGNVSFMMATRFQRIFGLVQCTPDLSAGDCSECINRALVGPCCLGHDGGRVINPSCNYRFETYSFYNETIVPLPSPPPPPVQPSPPPPPPPPPPPGKTALTIIIVVVSIAAALIPQFAFESS